MTTGRVIVLPSKASVAVAWVSGRVTVGIKVLQERDPSATSRLGIEAGSNPTHIRKADADAGRRHSFSFDELPWRLRTDRAGFSAVTSHCTVNRTSRRKPGGASSWKVRRYGPGARWATGRSIEHRVCRES